MGEKPRSSNVRNGVENAFRTCSIRRQEHARNNAQDQDQDQELSGHLELPSFCLEIQSRKAAFVQKLNAREHNDADAKLTKEKP